MHLRHHAMPQLIATIFVAQFLVYWAGDIQTCLCTSRDLVPDCCCDYKSTSLVNEQHVLPILRQLGENTKFFRYFRVALCGQCHHALPEPACGHPECTVCECTAEDLPCDQSENCYLNSPPRKGANSADCPAKDASLDADVDLKVDLDMLQWTEIRSEWTQDRGDALAYIDLLRNPERWTGYTAATGAHQVWKAVHDQASCVLDIGGQCRESRVFNRLISGFHASVSMHIAAGYCVKAGNKWMPCEEFGESMEQYRLRLHDHPQRIKNLYFAYLFVLRAVIKASPILAHFDYDAGDIKEASLIQESIQGLLEYKDIPCLGVTRYPFDESTVFAGENSGRLRDAFRDGFLNISSIMDCVGCGRCRLWGKLQLQGLATALRILFEGAAEKTASLTRTDVIALIHTLYRFSMSVSHVARLEALAEYEDTDDEL